MIELNETFKQRNAESEEQIREVLEFRNRKPAVFMGDVNYWTFGELTDLIPEDYYTNPASSLDYQLKKIKFHMESIKDDIYQPFLHPWFGTGVLASSFGIPVLFNYKSDPAVDLAKMKKPEDIDNLVYPVMGESGIMPNVVRCLDHYKQHCDLPIGITDCQGPLTTALQVAGYDKFCYWVYDEPKQIHKLMDIVTCALIDWVKFQKQRAGTAVNGACYPLALKIPDGYGGVWLADDDSVIVSGELFKEFVKPYNEKLLAAFDGGVIHYCGDSTQNIENYCETKGLRAIHNMNLDSIAAAKKMREGLRKKGVAYMACDFVPSDKRYIKYYEELIEAMGSPEGLVIGAYVAPAVELEKGKYEAGRRDSKKLALDVMETLRKLV